MKADERFDSLIRYHAEQVGLPFHWLWVKAQVAVESAFRPRARSEAGAQGLLQLMPATDREIDGEVAGFDVEGNLDNGIRYLKIQYDRLGEIPDAITRIRCALAAYNGGRGYINAALALGRKREGLPESYRDWLAAGSPKGRWQTWPAISAQLGEVQIGGSAGEARRPDVTQMLNYVDRIERWLLHMLLEANNSGPSRQLPGRTGLPGA